MIKIISRSKNVSEEKHMSEMETLEVGTIVGSDIYEETLVMRTADKDIIEVMNLSQPGPNRCWTIQKGPGCGLKVKPLAPGEEIVIRLFNSD